MGVRVPPTRQRSGCRQVIRARTVAPEATHALATAIGSAVQPGDVVLLAGEMGAGKTVFAQGFGAAMGVTERITSPTFTIANEYAGAQHVLHHLDVYRLSHLNEVLDAGLGEIIEEGAVVLIEWGDAIAPLLPRDFLEVRFTFGDTDDDRTIEIHCVGSRWSARHRVLSEALGPWREDR